MSSHISKPQHDRVPLSGKDIYVVGPRMFQNELLCYFLKREIGVECHTTENIRQIPVIDEENMRLQRQVLWDCLGKDSGTLMVEIESYDKMVLTLNLVALFGLDPNLGIEEKVLALGVRGFFYERDPLELFLKGIRAIFDGELWASRRVISEYILDRRPATPFRGNGILTHREVEILARITAGDTNDEIAKRLCISPHTVKTHLYRIFKKINVRNRLQAARWTAKNL